MNKKIIYFVLSSVIFLILIFSVIGFIYYAEVEAVSQTRVEIKSIDLIEIYASGVKLFFIVNFINPTGRRISDLSSDFNIYIDSIKIGEGFFSNIDIEPYDEISKEVLVTIKYSSAAYALKELILNFIIGIKTSFRLEGVITADVLFGLSETSHRFVATNI